MKLSEKKCIPCEDSSIEPMSCAESAELFSEYAEALVGWNINDACTHITMEKLFPDFITAIKWVNQVAQIAEDARNNTDISIWYNRIGLDMWTHSIGGLSENDFIVAAKINEII